MNHLTDAQLGMQALSGDLEQQLEQMKAAVKHFSGMSELLSYAEELNAAPRIVVDTTVSLRFAVGGNPDKIL